MKNKLSNLPEGLAAPARRALSGAGIFQLEDFAKFTESEVMTLHGMGPKAMNTIHKALSLKGLSFAPNK